MTTQDMKEQLRQSEHNLLNLYKLKKENLAIAEAQGGSLSLDLALGLKEGAPSVNETLGPIMQDRVDKYNAENKFTPKILNPNDGYHPPPWRMDEFPEKTQGWL